jgi:hypothetical protein
LHTILNERAELLTTTLPVVDLDLVATAPITIPHFAAGGGWATDILLLNPSDDSITGSVQFFSPEGDPQTLTSYAIPPRTSRVLHLDGGESTRTGSFIVTPDVDLSTPAVATVYAFKPDKITVSATGLAALRESTSFEILSASSASVQTGLALANPSAEPVDVTFQMFAADGNAVSGQNTIHIPAHGQKLSFVRELVGATELPDSFQGILRLSSPSPIAALAIRARYNERGDFLTSATPPVSSRTQTGEERFIPHVVGGAGYSTEIVIFDLSNDDGPLAGNLYFFNQAGEPSSIPITTR